MVTAILFFSPTKIFAEEINSITPVATENAAVTADEPNIFLNEGTGRYFSVYSYDPHSASFVVTLGETMGRWFENELKWDATLSNRPVRVELVPEVTAKWAEPYRLNANAGQVTLWIRWGKNTDSDALTRALAHAYLVRVFQINGATKPIETVPAWLVAALAREVTAQTQPALLDAWTRDAREKSPLPLENFLDEKTRESPSLALAGDDGFSLQAFWFWRHLRRDVAPQRGVILALARGGELEKFLAQAKPDIWKNPDRKILWWPVAYQQLLRERTPVSMTLAESREYLANAARFTFAIDGADKRFLAPDLITLRDLEAVKPEVARRQRHLKINISRANIVWHNAWRSYGVFLENFATADEATLRRLWAAAQADAVDASILEREINQVIAK